MEIILGLIGAKGAGKSTAFKLMGTILDAEEITLAGKLKDTCASVFKIPRNHFEDHKFKERDLNVPAYLSPAALNLIFKAFNATPDFDKHVRKHIGKILYTPRQIAQYVGTEVLRAYNTDIHCSNSTKGSPKKIGIVTDIRFPDELKYFADNFPKFYPIYIKNLQAEIRASKDTHSSEAHLKDLAKKAVKTLDNDTTIREFEDKIKAYLEEISHEL